MTRNCLLALIMFCITTAHAETELTKDILINGKWYNDEYSFTFTKKEYKAFYTFGKENGIMTGSIKLNKDNTITLNKGKVEGAFNTLFIPSDSIVLQYVEDLQNPKATRYFKDADSNIVLWNDTSFVKANQQVTMSPDNINCVTLGYELNATTDNVRIRKGPGTNYEPMQFSYKDATSGEIKTFGSVLAGTNIRVLARTADKMKVNEWFNNWYYVEYKEPKDNLLVYKNAWMFGEFINVPENKNRLITITSPENEESMYGAYTVTIRGEVTGAPVRMKIQIKNSYGNVTSEHKIEEYNQEEGSFSFDVSKDEDSLFIGSNTYNIVAVYSDNKSASKQITFYVHESGGEMAKPVIYLYPQKETQVNVSVNPANGISVSIPAYQNGWNVTAKPDGTIINSVDNEEYPYLFWESSKYNIDPIKEGFVVSKNDLSDFFMDKLSLLGLNSKEIDDFLEYWIPVLHEGNYYAITFYSKESIDKMAPLTISPQPDTVIRVFFDSKPLDTPILLREQTLVPAFRKGFTVIEWGGMRYPKE